MINYDKKEYEEAQAYTGEYAKLPAGGYICQIKEAKTGKSNSGNEMLILNIDIAEGEYKDYYLKQYEKRIESATADKPPKYPNNAILRNILSGKNWIERFKGIITSIEKSNSNFNWESCNGDESKLKGLYVGAIFREEEYEKIDGSIGTTVKIYQLRSIETIKNEKYKVPEIKKLPQKGEAYEGYGSLLSTSVADDDFPF